MADFCEAVYEISGSIIKVIVTKKTCRGRDHLGIQAQMYGK